MPPPAFPPYWRDNPAEVSPFADLELGEDATPVAYDVDGDGIVDLVVGSIDGTLKYYRGVCANTNTPTYAATSCAPPSYVLVPAAESPFDGIDVGESSAPALGDLNGDGHPELVVGARDGRLYLYVRTEDEGTAGGWHFGFEGLLSQSGNCVVCPTIDVGSYSKPSIGDLDLDGRPDLLIGEAEGTLSLLWHRGVSSPLTHTFGAWPTAPPVPLEWYTGPATPGGGSGSAPTIGDFDGDGDVDIMVGADDGTLTYLANQGSESGRPGDPWFPADGVVPPRPIGEDLKNPLDLGDNSAPAAIGDLNGDGLLELIVGNGDGELTYVDSLGIGPDGKPVLFPIGAGGNDDPSAGGGGTSSGTTAVRLQLYMDLDPSLFLYGKGRTTLPHELAQSIEAIVGLDARLLTLSVQSMAARAVSALPVNIGTDRLPFNEAEAISFALAEGYSSVQAMCASGALDSRSAYYCTLFNTAVSRLASTVLRVTFDLQPRAPSRHRTLQDAAPNAQLAATALACALDAAAYDGVRLTPRTNGVLTTAGLSSAIIPSAGVWDVRSRGSTVPRFCPRPPPPPPNPPPLPPQFPPTSPLSTDGVDGVNEALSGDGALQGTALIVVILLIVIFVLCCIIILLCAWRRRGKHPDDDSYRMRVRRDALRQDFSGRTLFSLNLFRTQRADIVKVDMDARNQGEHGGGAVDLKPKAPEPTASMRGTMAAAITSTSASVSSSSTGEQLDEFGKGEQASLLGSYPTVTPANRAGGTSGEAFKVDIGTPSDSASPAAVQLEWVESQRRRLETADIEGGSRLPLDERESTVEDVERSSLTESFQQTRPPDWLVDASKKRREQLG